MKKILTYIALSLSFISFSQEQIHWMKFHREVISSNGNFGGTFLHSNSFQDLQQGAVNSNSAFLGLTKNSRYGIGFGTDCPLVQIGVYDNATDLGSNMFARDKVDYFSLGTSGMYYDGSVVSYYDSFGRIIRHEAVDNGDTNWTEYHYNSQNQIDSIKRFLYNWNGVPIIVLGFEYENGIEVKRTKIDNSMSYTSVDSMVYQNGKISELWNKQKSHSDPDFDYFRRIFVGYTNGIIDYVEGQKYDSTQNMYIPYIHWDVLNNGTDIDRIHIYPKTSNTIDSSSISGIYKITQLNGVLHRYEYYLINDTVNHVESTQFTYSQPGFLSKVDHIFNGTIGSSYYQRNTTEFGYTSIVGIEELEQENIKVYPNPAQDILHIQSDEKIDFFEVYDQTGRMILRDKVTQSAFQINIDTLPPGTYLLVLPFSAENKVIRFVKE